MSKQQDSLEKVLAQMKPPATHNLQEESSNGPE